MKKLNLILICCIIPMFTMAQSNNESDTEHYLFDEFSIATVKMISGKNEKAMMNYNLVTEEMIFDKNGQMLALDKLELIDTIYLNNEVFIPVGKRFLHLVNNGPTPLFIQHKKNISSAGKPAAYGGTTQTSAVTSLSSLSGNGNIYKLKLPEEYILTEASMYWIKLDGKWHHFLNRSQLGGILNNRKQEINALVKKYSIDFKKSEEVVKLFEFLNQK